MISIDLGVGWPNFRKIRILRGGGDYFLCKISAPPVVWSKDK